MERNADDSETMQPRGQDQTGPSRGGESYLSKNATRIFLRPIGTPLALGFVALGGASLVLSGIQLGWFAPSESNYVALVLMAFAFPLQFLASILGFLARDTVAGTGMGILAGSWMLTGLVKYFSAPGSTSHVLGAFLIYTGAALLIPAVGSAFGKIVPALVFFVSALRYVLTGAYQLSGSTGVEYAAAGIPVAGSYGDRLLRRPGARHRGCQARDRSAGAAAGGGRGVDRGQPVGAGRPGRARGRRARAALTALICSSDSAGDAGSSRAPV